MRIFGLTAITFLCAVVALPAFAQKGGDHGGGNPGKGHGNPAAVETRGPAPQGPASHDTFVVVDRDRSTVSSYYRDEFARGNCPPGLAKKGNGCLPPGQAKKMWVVGQPLPPSVVYYPLPQPLYSRLTPPPPGYEYVRVDDDVLLMHTANRSILSLVVNLR